MTSNFLFFLQGGPSDVQIFSGIGVLHRQYSIRIFLAVFFFWMNVPFLEIVLTKKKESVCPTAFSIFCVKWWKLWHIMDPWEELCTTTYTLLDYFFLNYFLISTWIIHNCRIYNFVLDSWRAIHRILIAQISTSS